MLRTRLVAALGLLALVVGACTDSADPTTVPEATGPATTVAEVPDDPTTTTGVDPAPTTSEGSGTTVTVPPARVSEEIDPAVAAALQAEIAELLAATEELRGLPFLEPPDLAVVTPAELSEMIRAEAAEELGDIGPDERLLKLLGILDEETELLALIEELLAEQVLGFYDGETGELVVRGDADALSPLSRITVVHELIHVLTDQHFGFHDRFEALLDGEQFDEASALQALVEGDATYFQLVYIQEAFGLAELAQLQAEISSQDFSVLEASPEFLQQDLAFPYDDGYRFVTELVAQGGIAAVDDAYEDPPLTTEQILHPERYLAAEPPRPVELPPTPVDGYEVYEESAFGEWGLRLFFVGSDERGLVTQVGDGWGGDRYRVLDNGTDVALVSRYQADREVDAVEVTQAWLRLFEARFGEGVSDGSGELFATESAYGFVDREGDVLTVIAASDPAAGVRLRDALAAG